MKRTEEKSRSNPCNHQIACRHVQDGLFEIYLASVKYQKIPVPCEYYNFCPDCGKKLKDE